MEIKLDCRNQKYPLKQIIRLINDPSLSRIQVQTDNDSDADMISRFLGENGFEVGVDTNGIEFWVEGSPGSSREFLAEDNRPGSKTLIFISKPYVGETEDDLGTKLIQAFIETLYHADPGQLVLIHRGVGLQRGSQKVLNRLLENGWEILVCSTSLKRLGIDPAGVTGRVSKMSAISRALQRAEKIIPI